jgi:hypothetical protein
MLGRATAAIDDRIVAALDVVSRTVAEVSAS